MARLNSLPLKDHFRETLLFNQRMLVAVICAAFLILLLLFRLAYLQILGHQHYSTLSENNRVSIQPITPTRGLIYGRNGILLDQNLPSFRLELVPEHVVDLETTLAALQKIIQIEAEEINRFKRQVRRKRRFEGIPLRFRLSDAEVARIAVRRHQMPGVYIKADLARHYPLGPLMAHAVGYVGRIDEDELRRVDPSQYSGSHHIGKVGVEKYYEELLHGTVGHQKVETNAQGRVLHIIERTLPVTGQTLFLNLDANVQRAAESAFGDNHGALVAIDPRDGAVLALVSVPSYDPNLFVNGLDSKQYYNLSRSPDRPLFNRAIQGQYPPGSTLKPYIGLAGLELDMMQYKDEIVCPGWYMLKNDERRYRDWKKQGHGDVDLNRAIVESCDIYFYDLSLALGIDRIENFLARFGLGQLTGIDLPGEMPGLLPSRKWKKKVHGLPWFPGETLITGIGQGFTLTTPLQLAAISATLSKQGKRIKPGMVHAIRQPGSDKKIFQAPSEIGSIEIRNIDHWKSISDSMQKVVHSIYGTARSINKNLPYRVAGKTGTAQVFGIKQDEEYKEDEIAKKLRDHALFIAYAPVEDPSIAVAVIVENGGSGGSVAAPVARKVMDAYLLKEKTNAD